MKVLHYLLLYPYIWQGLLSSLFTLGLVWLLARVLVIKEAGSRVWFYSLPIVIPLLLPLKSGALLHWGPFSPIQNMLWLRQPSFNVFLVACFSPLAVALLQATFSYLAYCLFLRGGQEVTATDEPQLFALLMPLVQKVNIPLPQVYLLPPGRGVQIFVCGTLRSRLVLAPALLSALPPAELQAVLAHEVAHLVRHDHVFSWMTVLLRSLMFYNPVLYFLTKRLKQEREKAADTFASKLTGQPRALARGLLNVTKLALTEYHGIRAWFLPTAELTSGGALSERVRLLIDMDDRPNQDHPTRLRFFWLSFLILEIMFTLWVLYPLYQHAPCIMRVFL